MIGLSLSFLLLIFLLGNDWIRDSLQEVEPVGKSICPNCGAELLSTTSVCPYCGRDVGLR